MHLFSQLNTCLSGGISRLGSEFSVRSVKCGLCGGDAGPAHTCPPVCPAVGVRTAAVRQALEGPGERQR